jgi:hypothetical protein
MSEEALVLAGLHGEPAFNEKSEECVEDTNDSKNPVIKSAEFALLVSVDLTFGFFFFKHSVENQYHTNKRRRGDKCCSLCN